MKYKYCLVILVVLLFCGCSTKLAYNYMDWAIQWKVRSFVSLNKTQKQQTKLAAKAFHKWHRVSQLTQYADYLQYILTRLSQGSITSLDIQNETAQVQKLIDQSLTQATPDLINLIFELNDKQALELLQSYQDERKEYSKKYVNIDLKKQEHNRYKELHDFLKPWLGSLSKKQKDQITRWSKSLKPYEKLNISQQILWETQLKNILEERKDRAKLSEGVKLLLFSRSNEWEPEIRDVFEYNQNLTYELLASIVNKLSNKQENKLIKQLNYYIKTCRDLSE